MVVGKEHSSLRPGRRELTLLAWAFGISLVVHLVSYGTYDLGKHLGWWQHLQIPAWLQTSKTQLAAMDKTKNARPEKEQIPLMFIETTPIQSVAEAPKDARFYSDKNTAAGNPTADKDSTVPKIEGTQSQVAKTQDTTRENNMSLRPSLPAPEIRTKPKETSGDLAFAKLNDTKRNDTGNAERPRPRTLAEARQLETSRIPGEKMKQEGGVRHHLDFSSVDAKATSFGAYDAAFVEAVVQRWYDLLDQRNLGQERPGRVVVDFRLNYDGRVTDMKIVENTVGVMQGLICQKAVLEPAPFATWPSDMRRMLGDSRQIEFTFYYNDR